MNIFTFLLTIQLLLVVILLIIFAIFLHDGFSANKRDVRNDLEKIKQQINN